MRRAPRMNSVTAVIRLRAPSPFGAPSRHSPDCYLWLSFGLRFLRQEADCPLPCSEAPRGPVALPDEQGPKPPEGGLGARAQAPRLAPSISTSPVDAPDERA